MRKTPKCDATVTAYERGLKGLEAHERPPDYEGLTSATRSRASFYQFMTFAKTYWPMWRFVKLSLYQRLLAQRADIEGDLSGLLRGDHVSAASRAYQDITNGLLAAAATELCQYAEDLAILCEALRSGDYFARNLTRFSAGRIQNKVRSWLQISEDDARATLFVPNVPTTPSWPNEACQKAYTLGIAEVRECLHSIAASYTLWFEHHIRYKHGMLLALSPFGQDIKDSEYISRRQNSDGGFPVAFDAACVAEAVRRPEFRQLLMIPDVGNEHVRLNALELSREGNLLRFLMPPLGNEREVSLSDLVRLAARIGQMQQIAINNYAENCNPDRQDGEWKCYLPQGQGFVTLASGGRAPG